MKNYPDPLAIAIIITLIVIFIILGL